MTEIRPQGATRSGAGARLGMVPAPAPAPALFAFDGGYDPVQLTVELCPAPGRKSWSVSVTTGCSSPARRHACRVAAAVRRYARRPARQRRPVDLAR
uniref:hypothetical protein n=1 Tax=Paractinoplanes polyasparticus TaxID=2856853 RepID=UPI001C859ADD|nr:hypothetical protein [Actinoplanes polyasparticus]